MRMVFAALVLAAAFAPWHAAAASGSGCKLVKLAELPLRAHPHRLIVDGAINGKPIGILLDTGAATSLVLRAAAIELGLPRQAAGYRVFGIGGETAAETTLIEEFRLGKAVRKDWRLLVAGERGLGGDVAVVLGDDFFENVDAEFDLAQRVVRLFRPLDCGGRALSYWTAERVGEVDIEAGGRIVLAARVNGEPLRALLDTGAPTSVIALPFAAALGITPQTAGVAPAECSAGLGSKVSDSWMAPFASFAISDELVRNPRIRIADIWRHTTLTEIGSRLAKPVDVHPAMILGVDFLRAHRVLVSRSQAKVYFGYVGGVVFPADVGTSCSERRERQAREDAVLAELDERVRLNPQDPLAFAARADALSRQGYGRRAIADYDAAIRLDPALASAFEGRALAWRAMRKYEQAVADYEAQVRLNHRPFQSMRDLGLSLFMQGRYDRAAEVFPKALQLLEDGHGSTRPTYLAIWTHMARARGGGRETGASQVAATGGKESEWPQPILRMFRGELDPANLVPTAPPPDARKRQGQQCEADFYAGQWHLARGDRATARPLIARAGQGCPRNYFEYELALAELDRLDRPVPP